MGRQKEERGTRVMMKGKERKRWEGGGEGIKRQYKYESKQHHISILDIRGEVTTGRSPHLCENIRQLLIDFGT